MELDVENVDKKDKKIMMTVVCPGSLVKIGKGDIEAIVISVLIGEKNHVQYKCTWWSGRDRKEDRVESREVAFNYKDSIKIGFINEQHKT